MFLQTYRTYCWWFLFDVKFKQLDRSTAAPFPVLIRKVCCTEVSPNRCHDDLSHSVVREPVSKLEVPCVLVACLPLFVFRRQTNSDELICVYWRLFNRTMSKHAENEYVVTVWKRLSDNIWATDFAIACFSATQRILMLSERATALVNVLLLTEEIAKVSGVQVQMEMWLEEWWERTLSIGDSRRTGIWGVERSFCDGYVTSIAEMGERRELENKKHKQRDLVANWQLEFIRSNVTCP